MGIEIPHEYGGSEASFTTAIIAIEELAKVDPSISVMADVHVFPLYLRNNIEYFGEYSF
jgi:alkylation response protein AidB-like acyl-CoA dehydrogenase